LYQDVPIYPYKIADQRGHRSIAQGNQCECWLSSDGQWVLIAPNGIDGAGTRLTLYEVATGRRLQSTLPDVPEIHQWIRRPVEGNKPWITWEASPAFLPSGGFVLRLTVGKRPTVSADWQRMFWHVQWSPDDGWQSMRKRPAVQLIRAVKPRYISSGDMFLGSEPGQPAPVPKEPLVVFPCDGPNAQRTIWIRPDGSTLEISRQDDAPGLFMLGVATLPVWPVVSLWGGTLIAWSAESTKAQDQTTAEYALATWVARRKAAWAEFHPADAGAGAETSGN